MRYEVDSARVAQGSAAVQTAAVQITAEVDRMMHCLTELQSCWTGRAAVSLPWPVPGHPPVGVHLGALTLDDAALLHLAGELHR